MTLSWTDAPEGRDVGAEVGHRRIAYLQGFALWIALGILLLLAVVTAQAVGRARWIDFRVDTSDGRVKAQSGDVVIADSLVYQPDRLLEVAKDYVSLRYEYDFRAGRSAMVAAATMRDADCAKEVGDAPPDLLARWDAQRTRIELRYDSAWVETRGKGTYYAQLRGTRVLHNVQYSDALGGRPTPYAATVILRAVKVAPAFPHGVAVCGARTDLDS